MKKLAHTTAIHILKTLLYGIVGAVIVIVFMGVRQLNNRPDLKVWQTTRLTEEFTRKSPVHSFDEYLQLEDRLFKQLDNLVYDQIEPEEENPINRYYRDSISNPARWPQNWNRSFELSHDTPRAGVLLIHGMSDSPYSLRTIGERLHDNGAQVLGLRVPGHGTAPSGLIHVKWEDMAAAVQLAIQHLKEKTPGQPLYILGYSNGAALAVHYALDQLEDPDLPQVKALVLISPEIAITRLAALAIWQERLGHLLGLRKLAWTDILPEYDPFKYNSFATNAGVQVRRITVSNQSRLTNLSKAGKLNDFPRVLAFQSAVDATVSASAVVTVLFDHLPDNGHELVAFDLNRYTAIEPLLKADPMKDLDHLLKDTNRKFMFRVLTNESEESQEVVVRSWAPGAAQPTSEKTGLSWPGDIYSLTHIALPFPGDDPLYGGDNPGKSPGIQLGNMAFQGEKGVLIVSSANLLRLRWNPFYSYLEPRALEHFQLSSP